MQFNILYGKHNNLNNFPLQEGNLYVTDRGCVYVDAKQNNELTRLCIGNQVNWSANNEQEGYIQNRTHWYGKQREVLIKDTFEKYISENFVQSFIDPQEDNFTKIIPDSKYAVIIDNQEYIVTAYTFTDTHGDVYNCLGDTRRGDPDIIGENEHIENVPFLITQSYYSVDLTVSTDSLQNDIIISTDNENSIVKIEKLLDSVGYMQLPEEYIPEEIARIAALPQLNWQENDENNAQYIKNRTHYYGAKLTQTYSGDNLFDGAFFDIVEGQHNATFVWADTPLDGKAQFGDYWIVEFDGVKYKCQSYKLDYEYALGDSRKLQYDIEEHQEDVPFGLMWCCDDINGWEWRGQWYLYTNDTNPHSISLYHISNTEEDYNKLDIRYIPNANWEVRKGQEGYIENRTHYKEYELRYVFKDEYPHNLITISLNRSKYGALAGYDPEEWEKLWSDALLHEYGIPNGAIVVLDGVWYEGLPIWSHVTDWNAQVWCIGDSRLTTTPMLDEDGNLMYDEDQKLISEVDMSHPADVPFAIECYEYDDGGSGGIWYSDYTIYCNKKYSSISLGTATTLKYHTLDENYIPEEAAFKTYLTEAVDNAIGGSY